MKKYFGVLLMLLFVLLAAAANAQGAVIDNGSDPASRLNIRIAPDRSADAIGKFFSGTPVEIVADAGGGWSQVCIGGGRHAVSGYAMTEYLRSSSAVDAREIKTVVSPYGTPSVVLRSRPSNSYDAVMMLPVGACVTVVGVSGDFCYVLAEDGSAGCLLAGELN